MKVLVSVLNYNSLSKTQHFVDGLFGGGLLNEYDFIFLDNSDCYELDRLVVPKIIPDGLTISLLRSPENIGFAKGHNVVLKTEDVKAKNYDLFLIANNDVSFSLEVLDSTIYEVGLSLDLFSPKILNADGSVWYAGGAIHPLTGDLTVNRSNDIHEGCDFICGCFMFVRPWLYYSLGGFDERFFMYAEDLMFSLKARSAGAKMSIVPFNIIHDVGSGVSGIYSNLYLYENTKNRLICLRERHLGVYPISVVFFLLKYLVGRCVQLLFINPRKFSEQFRYVWRGLIDGISQR